MLKVEQSDRDAAAAYVDTAIRMIGYAAKVQAGEMDDSQLVQAFAAYRIKLENTEAPMTKGDELLACPFCGEPGDIEEMPSYSQAASTYFAYRGWCNNCCFGLEWVNHERDAITAWNTRSQK